jgi:hypothetical protein
VTQYQSKSKGHKDKDPSLELSIGQVLAAAGATVLGAVLAKLLNLWGTIPGTAFLSVFSAIGSVLILRAVRRTGDRVKAQIQAMAPKGAAKGTAVTVEFDPDGTGDPSAVKATARIPETGIAAAAEDPSGDATTTEIPAPEPETHTAKSASRKRTLLAILISSVLVFGLTVGALYLFGALTGDPDRLITTDPDTTTTIIVESPAEDGTTAEETPSESATPSESPSETPSESASAGESPSVEATPSESASADTGQGGASEETAGSESQDPTPTAESTTAG